MGTPSFGWASRALAVASKDLRAEYRSRYAVNAIGMFAATCLALVSFGVGPFRIAAGDRPFLLSLLLWLCLFFSAMTGLSRVFVKEEDARTANSLRLATEAGTVFAGKFLFNLVLMVILDLLVVPLFVLVMDFAITQAAMFAAVIGMGSLGLVCGTTLVAGIIGKARVQGGLFAVLAFPAVFPILMVAVRGCEKAASGVAAPLGELQMLGSMAGILTLVSVLLFPFVWEA